MSRPLEAFEVRAGHFTAEVDDGPGFMTVRLSGTADQLVRDQLQALLGHLQPRANECGAGEIVVDVRDLYFMNSSCLSVVMRWITSLIKTGSGLRVRFTCNENLRWQRRSLQAMATLGSGLITVD